MKNEMMRNACVLMVILMAVGSTSTLTTFGLPKNNENDQNKTQPPPIVRGRECKADPDCNGITNTVCMRDPRDRKTRCLCVNKSAPVNGACPRYPKGRRGNPVPAPEQHQGHHRLYVPSEGRYDSNSRIPPLIQCYREVDKQALKSACSDDKECIDGAHCSTQTNSSSSAKSCMCKEGFYEEDHMCNAGFLSTAPSVMSLLIAFSVLSLVSKADSTF